jgi:hypothetical protein
VVKSIADTSECVPVILDMSVDLPRISTAFKSNRCAAHLSNRWEADESNRCYTCTRNIEARASASASTTRGGDELSAELCKLGFELAKMVARGLILLGWAEDMSWTRQQGAKIKNALLAW